MYAWEILLSRSDVYLDIFVSILPEFVKGMTRLWHARPPLTAGLPDLKSRGQRNSYSSLPQHAKTRRCYKYLSPVLRRSLCDATYASSARSESSYVLIVYRPFMQS